MTEFHVSIQNGSTSHNGVVEALDALSAGHQFLASEGERLASHGRPLAVDAHVTSVRPMMRRPFTPPTPVSSRILKRTRPRRRAGSTMSTRSIPRAVAGVWPIVRAAPRPWRRCACSDAVSPCPCGSRNRLSSSSTRGEGSRYRLFLSSLAHSYHTFTLVFL